MTIVWLSRNGERLKTLVEERGRGSLGCGSDAEPSLPVFDSAN